MNLINKKTTTLVLSALAVVAITGCGSDGEPSESGLVPGKMTTERAKDAMALNAIAYRVITPVYTGLRNFISGGIAPVSAVASSNLPSCDEGSYDEIILRDENDNLVGKKFIFDNCKTTNPNGDFQTPMVNFCAINIFPMFLPEASSAEISTQLAPSYYSIMDGEVTCERTDNNTAYAVNLDKYVVTSYNSSQGDNRWEYDMKIDFSIEAYEEAGVAATGTGYIENAVYTLEADGDIRGQYWVGLPETTPLKNDEKWTMAKLKLKADHPGNDIADIIEASGKASYLGEVREGDTDNNGMELSIEFDKYAYQFNMPTTINPAHVDISGKVKASCHPAWVTYATIDTMVDDNTTKDSLGDRMPSQGEMTLATDDTEGKAEVGFSVISNHAAVTISTEEEGDVTYNNWKDIIEDSSCEIFQDIIDRILVPESV